MKINEGLKEGDLRDLVLPLINIDEYESKLDDDSIVIAFYVKDKDPAADLNRFIQKGSVDLLDTDLSPAPNEDGYYVVFVEIMRDADFPNKVDSILDSLRGLTGIQKWKCQVFEVDGLHPVDRETLTKIVRLESKEDHPTTDIVDTEVEESIQHFFKDSILESISLTNGKLTLEGIRGDFTFSLVDFDTLEGVRENNAVMSQGYRLDETAQHNVSRLQALLGDHWLVEHLANHVVLSHYASDKVALLKL